MLIENSSKFLLVCFSFIFLHFIVQVSSLKSVNPLIEVGKEIYCQHDKYNQTVYSIKKSGQKLTTVYKVIVPQFTAKKVWTREGKYIEDKSTVQHGGTAPEDYISVKEGEEYYFKLYGCGSTKQPDGSIVYYAPVVFFDENNNFITDALTSTWGTSKNGTIVIVPQKATKMYITNYNNQGLTVHQRLNMTDEEIDNLPFSETKLKKNLNSMYDTYLRDRVVYKKARKGALIFMISTTSNLLNEYVDIFLKKKVPLTLGIVPENLIDNCRDVPESRLHAVKRLLKEGQGEILATNQGALSEENFQNYSELYRTFIRPKQYFNNLGIEVNGLLYTSGKGSVISNETEEKWASSIYSYADRYGIQYGKEISNGHVYYQPPTYLGSYTDQTKFINLIEKCVNEKNIVMLYFNSFDQVNSTVLELMLDYVKKRREEGDLELSLYKDIYAKYAMKESNIQSTRNTFYVSNSGNKNGGNSEKNPMDWNTMLNYYFYTGDTIKLKNGDTFYGKMDLKYLNINGSILTITNYGDKKLPKPTISGYKVVDKKASWTLFDKEKSIYQIDLMNTNNYFGVMNTDNYTNNIGFLMDSKGTFYGHLKFAVQDMNNIYDFYCDGKILLFRTKSKNPYEELGTLRLSTRTMLVVPKSNMKFENLHITGTGGHGMQSGLEFSENIEISNNVIDDIGGSWQHDQVRFGNSIEFWESHVRNLTIKNNIIRNTYDSGFTIQGYARGGKDAYVIQNLFITNSQDSEIFGSKNATGIYNYVFEDNLSINQGRSWGFEARPNKGSPAFILFFTYAIENTLMTFRNNTAYNPRRIYYVSSKDFFKRDKIISNNNTYYINNDTTIWWDQYKFNESKNFSDEYHKDQNSKFIELDKTNKKNLEVASKSMDFWEIRELFIPTGRKIEYLNLSDNSANIIIVVIIVIIAFVILAFFIYRIIKKKNSITDLNLKENQNYEILLK